MNRAASFLLVCLLSSGFLSVTFAQVNIGSTMVDTSTVVSNLDTPWEILWGPDDHIWITERQGRVSSLNPETGELTELITIDDVYESGESGLLGMVLHPDFENTPEIFLVYNYLEFSSIKERLVRYTYVDGELLSPLTLLEGIDGGGNHNGSRLVIDVDQKLYMTTGDAGNTSTSQDLSSLSGKILRMNLDGTIPTDNPIADSYIWTWGHRNPQGLVIAPNGMMYSSEHGPSSDDELNIIEKGRNYGWPNVKGFCDNITEEEFCTSNNVVEPIAAWTPTLAVCGTDFYQHTAIPQWQNSVLVTSLKANQLVSLTLSEDGRSVLEEEAYFDFWFGRLRDLCIAPDGRVFIAVSNRDGRGTIRPGDDRIIELKARNNKSYCQGTQTATICPGDSYTFNGHQISQPGSYTDTIPYQDGCDSIITLSLQHYETQAIGLPDTMLVTSSDTFILSAQEGFLSYSWNDQPPSQDNTFKLEGNKLGQGTHFITIRVEDLQGCVQEDTITVIVSAISGLQAAFSQILTVYPNPLSGNELKVEYTSASEAVLIVYSSLGAEISRSALSPKLNTIVITLPDASGIYLIKIRSRDGVKAVKVLKN